MRMALWKRISTDCELIQDIVPVRYAGAYLSPTEGQWAGIRFRANGHLLTPIPGGPVLRPVKPGDDALLAEAHVRAGLQLRHKTACANLVWGAGELEILSSLASLTEAAAAGGHRRDLQRRSWIAALRQILEAAEKDT